MSEEVTRACLDGPGGRSDWLSGGRGGGEREVEAGKSEVILGNL